MDKYTFLYSRLCFIIIYLTVTSSVTFVVVASDDWLPDPKKDVGTVDDSVLVDGDGVVNRDNLSVSDIVQNKENLRKEFFKHFEVAHLPSGQNNLLKDSKEGEEKKPYDVIVPTSSVTIAVAALVKQPDAFSPESDRSYIDRVNNDDILKKQANDNDVDVTTQLEKAEPFVSDKIENQNAQEEESGYIRGIVYNETKEVTAEETDNADVNLTNLLEENISKHDVSGQADVDESKRPHGEQQNEQNVSLLLLPQHKEQSQPQQNIYDQYSLPKLESLYKLPSQLPQQQQHQNERPLGLVSNVYKSQGQLTQQLPQQQEQNEEQFKLPLIPNLYRHQGLQPQQHLPQQQQLSQQLSHQQQNEELLQQPSLPHLYKQQDQQPQQQQNEVLLPQPPLQHLYKQQDEPQQNEEALELPPLPNLFNQQDQQPQQQQQNEELLPQPPLQHLYKQQDHQQQQNEEQFKLPSLPNLYRHQDLQPQLQQQQLPQQQLSQQQLSHQEQNEKLLQQPPLQDLYKQQDHHPQQQNEELLELPPLSHIYKQQDQQQQQQNKKLLQLPPLPNHFNQLDQQQPQEENKELLELPPLPNLFNQLDQQPQQQQNEELMQLPSLPNLFNQDQQQLNKELLELPPLPNIFNQQDQQPQQQQNELMQLTSLLNLSNQHDQQPQQNELLLQLPPLPNLFNQDQQPQQQQNEEALELPLQPDLLSQQDQEQQEQQNEEALELPPLTNLFNHQGQQPQQQNEDTLGLPSLSNLYSEQNQKPQQPQQQQSVEPQKPPPLPNLFKLRGEQLKQQQNQNYEQPPLSHLNESAHEQNENQELSQLPFWYNPQDSTSIDYADYLNFVANEKKQKLSSNEKLNNVSEFNENNSKELTDEKDKITSFNVESNLSPYDETLVSSFDTKMPGIDSKKEANWESVYKGIVNMDDDDSDGFYQEEEEEEEIYYEESDGDKANGNEGDETDQLASSNGEQNGDNEEYDAEVVDNQLMEEVVDEELAKRNRLPTAPTSMVLFYTWMIVAVLIFVVGISMYQSRCKGLRIPGIRSSSSGSDRKRLLDNDFV